jgi:putative membrane protein
MVMASLQGLPAFLLYFCVASLAIAAYLFVYTRITAHDEFALIAANIPGAAVALGLSVLGFSLPVASAIAHSADILDCAIWSLIALIVQIIVYYIVRLAMPDISRRIAAGEMASALWLGLASLTAGLLSAASMTI